VLLGHSVGELAAAALAGVFDLPAAARILRGRSAALVNAPAGGMLAVAATPEQVASIIAPEWAARGLAIGAVNAPAQTILAGAEPELNMAEHAAKEAGLTVRRVRSRQPFHSPVLDEAAKQFAKAIAAERLHVPRIPVTSARTCRIVEPHEALDPVFWARLMSEPVLFWPALSSLPSDGEFAFVEAGPGNGLSTAARRHPSVRAGHSEVLTLLPPPGREQWPVWQAGLERLAALDAQPPGPQDMPLPAKPAYDTTDR
jgi:acyl transferase domain-containing protein